MCPKMESKLIKRDQCSIGEYSLSAINGTNYREIRKSKRCCVIASGLIGSSRPLRGLCEHQRACAPSRDRRSTLRLDSKALHNCDLRTTLANDF
ncbi:hypothetical protein EVAR_65692_1 [Eumeta japonica]|uniref:Uncharacterized protein n=1 Tax=Eumeta variegata TaxID=151549 RepID=A0A4C1Z9Q0_EUMVA|nr:hypothetical protein EVAR_65692_1 [Eumeta japonica]